MASAEVATVGNDIAVPNAEKEPGAEQTGWHNADIAKRKKAAKPTGKRKIEGGRKKMAPTKKTWVIKVQHPFTLMLTYLYNR